MFNDSFDLAAVMRGLMIAAGLALAGCTGTGAPVAPETTGAEPHVAILYRNTVTVQFSDGALCVAPRPGAARAWQGHLAGCPHLLPYEVTLPAGPLAARRVLVRLAGGGASVIAIETARFGVPGGV